MLMDGERKMRVGDGLGTGVYGGRVGREVLSCRDIEEVDGLDMDTEVAHPETTEKSLPSRFAATSLDSAMEDGPDSLNLGIGVTFRREIINWMLNVR